MRWLFLTLLGLLGVAAGLTWSSVLSSGQPHIAITNSVLDIGVVSIDQETIRRVPVRNSGSAPLVIHSIQASCGCTRVEINKTALGPGETAMMEVAIAGRNGRVAGALSTIEVSSNDPLLPILRIPVVGRPTPSIEVFPAIIDFGRVSQADLPARVAARINFIANEVPPADEVAIQSTKPYVLIRDVRRSGPRSIRFEIEITDAAPLGRMLTWIGISGTGSSDVLNVKTQAEILGRTVAYPASIVMRHRSDSLVGKGKITLSSRESIARVDVQVSDVVEKVDARVVRDGSVWSVVIAPSEQSSVKPINSGVARGELIITVHYANELTPEEIRVPVTILRG